MSTGELTLVAVLGALVGGRVYPAGSAFENVQKPYITYQLISAPRADSVDGDGHLVNPRFQVDLWGDVVLDLLTLRETVKAAVDASSLNSFLLDEGNDFDTAARLHRRRLDFAIWTQD